MILKSKIAMISFLALFTFILSDSTFAHCDSMEGPVVKAAQKALETGNINYVLIWIKAEYESEIQNLFDKVLRVRTLNNEALELADMYFYETVVRLHRMGEGVGYTGLKPAGYRPEEGIEAADIAIEKGSVEEILQHADKSKHSDVIKYFNDVQLKKNYKVNDIKAGREFVEAYVHFIHYVEKLFNTDKNENQHNTHNQNHF
ncbi:MULTISPECIES: DUF6448 family protein [unclassified Melioribacter]|uniref:DUF6448 family protein n=1 Tax=unclassified Melioribacter TaxID=2627329 RepID=UPI003BC1B099